MPQLEYKVTIGDEGNIILGNPIRKRRESSLKIIKRKLEYIRKPVSVYSDSKLYKVLKKEFGFKKVYYPGSDVDATPALVFDETIFLDVEKKPLDKIRFYKITPRLRKRLKKIKLIVGDAKKYSPPNDVGLLILLNITCEIKPILDRFHRKGYIVCNEYFRFAQTLLKEPNKYEFLGQVTEKGVVMRTLEEFKTIRNRNVDTLWLFRKH